MKSIIALAIAMLFAVPSFAAIQVSPTQVRMGPVKAGVGGYYSDTVFVRNTSDQRVNLQTSGMCPMDFIVSNSCYSLSAYGNCSIRIQYQPRNPGYHSCNLTIGEWGGTMHTIFINGQATR